MRLTAELRAAHAELVAIASSLDAGGWIEAGRLGFPTVLSEAGLITIARDGHVSLTAAGRRLTALALRPEVTR